MRIERTPIQWLLKFAPPWRLWRRDCLADFSGRQYRGSRRPAVQTVVIRLDRAGARNALARVAGLPPHAWRRSAAIDAPYTRR